MIRRLRQFLHKRQERAAHRKGRACLCVRADYQIIEPGEADLIRALEGMEAETGSAFMILSRSDHTYLQCSGDNHIGYDLEYQVNSIEEHFRAAQTNFDCTEIVRRFLAYSRDGLAWKDGVEWQRIDW